MSVKITTRGLFLLFRILDRPVGGVDSYFVSYRRWVPFLISCFSHPFMDTGVHKLKDTLCLSETTFVYTIKPPSVSTEWWVLFRSGESSL